MRIVFALLLIALVLAGCDSIGGGGTIQPLGKQSEKAGGTGPGGAAAAKPAGN